VNGTLTDKTVLVIGRGSGIARAVTEAARAAGAKVIVAGRDQEKLAAAYDDPGITTETVDVTNDSSIEALAGRLDGIDHVVCTASARARGTLAELAAAFNIQVGTLAVAITNGAADTLTRSLAVELAPIRVNAISPGVIDTGAWDGLGEDGKARLYARATETFPARRVGEGEDIADAVLFCLTNTYLTGVTLKVDGGEALV
jgi:NAD(P)-dependent dehydrogenase (short-subunit alcohol dehydrogenase family)